MNFETKYTFANSQKKVWDILTNYEQLKKCIPGCNKINLLEEDKYEINLTIGIASIKGNYKGTISMFEKKEPDSYKIKLSGTGNSGFIDGIAVIKLEEIDATTTDILINAEASVGGLIARIGQRILGHGANILIKQTFDCIQKNISTQ